MASASPSGHPQKKRKTKTNDNRDWPSLPSDLLTIISSRLNAVDYQSFTRVCTSWSNAKAQRTPLIPFMFLRDDRGGHDAILYSVADNFSWSLSLPSWPSGKTRCVGSQHGWLIILQLSTYSLSLLNPLTNHHLQLPWFVHYHPYDAGSRPCSISVSIVKAVMSCAPTVGVSPPNVVAICSKGFLLYLPSGESKWYILEGSYEEICCWDGEFYALEKHFGILHSLSFYGPQCKLKWLAWKGFSQDMEGCSNSYLIKLGDNLIKVWRHYDSSTQRTDAISILKLDAKRGSWEAVQGLGDCSLFLGINISFAFSPYEVPGLVQNFIYFTDDWIKMYTDLPHRYSTLSKWSRDVGCYDIRNGTFATCPLPYAHLQSVSSIWFAPSTLQTCSFDQLKPAFL